MPQDHLFLGKNPEWHHSQRGLYEWCPPEVFAMASPKAHTKDPKNRNYEKNRKKINQRGYESGCEKNLEWPLIIRERQFPILRSGKSLKT